MKIYDFNERLKDAILIADGAMGSMLHEAVGFERCFDELNSTEPEAVSTRRTSKPVRKSSKPTRLAQIALSSRRSAWPRKSSASTAAG